MRTRAAQHFQGCPVGQVGRKRKLLGVAALLRFAATRTRASDWWVPPAAETVKDVIGNADRHHEDSTPNNPEQLTAMLDSLRDAGKDELHLAVSLAGLFGLRPAELGELRGEEGKLHDSAGKPSRKASFHSYEFISC